MGILRVQNLIVVIVSLALAVLASEAVVRLALEEVSYLQPQISPHPELGHVVLPGTGVLMNNSVSYFDPRPGYPTTMAGRKRINASNMCPTVATRDGQAIFAVGASGANHIMPCTLQVAAFMLDHGLSLEDAFNAPRIDASDRGSVRVDPRVGDAVLRALAQSFTLEVAQRLVFPKLYSCPSGVARDPATGLCHGISDPSQPIAGAAAPAPFALPHPPRSAVRA